MSVNTHGIGGLRSSFPNLTVSGFQRPFVWKNEQKASLIVSLVRDYPTGILVLNKSKGQDENGNESTTYDIIDGQQRFSTLLHFLRDPFIYFLEWDKKGEFDELIDGQFKADLLRGALAESFREYRILANGFVTKGMTPAEKMRKFRAELLNHFQLKQIVSEPPGPVNARADIFDRCISLGSLFSDLVQQRNIAIQSLDSVEPHEAEEIFNRINSKGETLTWWQLLAVDPFYAHQEHDFQVRDHELSKVLADAQSRLRANLPQGLSADTQANSIWHACQGLSFYINDRLQGAAKGRIFEESLAKRAIPVDALGFRLLAGFLGYTISKAGIYDVQNFASKPIAGDKQGATYSAIPIDADQRLAVVNDVLESLYRTIDVLIDACEGFTLFKKISETGEEAMPSYPLMGLYLSAAYMVHRNKTKGQGVSITPTDQQILRRLYVQLATGALIQDEWKGSGDSKLHSWLGQRFAPIDPATGGWSSSFLLSSTSENADPDMWSNFLDGQEATSKRTIDKKSKQVLFFLQYLRDSKHPGSLPRQKVDADHIVPYEEIPGSNTTHFGNFSLIGSQLNKEKGRKSLAKWNPKGGNRHDYLAQIGMADEPGLCSAGKIEDLVKHRMKLHAATIRDILPNWISDGN